MPNFPRQDRNIRVGPVKLKPKPGMLERQRTHLDVEHVGSRPASQRGERKAAAAAAEKRGSQAGGNRGEKIFL